MSGIIKQFLFGARFVQFLPADFDAIAAIGTESYANVSWRNQLFRIRVENRIEFSHLHVCASTSFGRRTEITMQFYSLNSSFVFSSSRTLLASVCLCVVYLFFRRWQADIHS